MTKEVDRQKQLIDAFRFGGGAAHKLSSRFLVGVVDLLVKMPEFPSWLFEVKVNDRPKKLTIIRDAGLTVPQKNFLTDYHEAGMDTGVISFLHDGRKTYIGVFMNSLGMNLPVDGHIETGVKPEAMLESFWTSYRINNE